MPDLSTPSPRLLVDHPATDVTVITGLEGPLEPSTPVRCRYCRHDVVADDDHAVDCVWKRGKAGTR